MMSEKLNRLSSCMIWTCGPANVMCGMCSSDLSSFSSLTETSNVSKVTKSFCPSASFMLKP